MIRPDAPTGTPQVAPGSPAAALAGSICALQALALLCLGGFYVWEVARGEQDSVARALTSAVLIIAVAGGLAAIARGWFRGAAFARTPTLVWNALLLPVAWSLLQSGHAGIAAAIGGTAVVALVAAWRAAPADHG